MATEAARILLNMRESSNDEQSIDSNAVDESDVGDDSEPMIPDQCSKNPNCIRLPQFSAGTHRGTCIEPTSSSDSSQDDESDAEDDSNAEAEDDSSAEAEDDSSAEAKDDSDAEAEDDSSAEVEDDSDAKDESDADDESDNSSRPNNKRGRDNIETSKKTLKKMRLDIRKQELEIYRLGISTVNYIVQKIIR